MLYGIHGIDNVKLAIGISDGMMAAASTSVGEDLVLIVDKGMGRVGTLEDDASIINKAALGFNQPGTSFEFAGANITLPVSKDSYVWMKTDKSLVRTDYAADPNTVAPELGPDPHRGKIIPTLQEGQLRYKEAASVLICRAITDGTKITSVDNMVRNKIVAI